MLKFTVFPFSHDEGYCSDAEIKLVQADIRHYYVIPSDELLKMYKEDAGTCEHIEVIFPEFEPTEPGRWCRGGYCGTDTEIEIQVIDNRRIFDPREYRKCEVEILRSRYEAYEAIKRGPAHYGLD